MPYNSETTRQIISSIFVRVTCGYGSVIRWRRRDTLCTSGFVDDVAFVHNGPKARRVYSYAAIEHGRHNGLDSN